MGVSELENEKLNGEIERIAKKSLFKRKLVSTLVLCVVILITFLAVGLFVRNQAKKDYQATIDELKLTVENQEKEIEKLIETPIVVNPVSPEIILDTIQSEISAIAELATVEYLFTDAARFTDSKQFRNWNIPFTQKSFLIKWDGVIKAGVNLDDVSIEVEKGAMKIVVNIPAAEILSYEIDQDSVEVLDEKDNIFNKLTIEDKVKFDAATEEAMKERAIENGILDKAQKNAEDIIKNMLIGNPAIGHNYTIEFVIIGK